MNRPSSQDRHANASPHNARIGALDLGRGMSVILMVWVHTLWMYGDKATQTESWFGTVIHFIGRGTPMFLLAMGFSLMLSRRQTRKGLALRGLALLALGYAMNILKFIVPIDVFGTMPENFIAAYGWQSVGLSQRLYLIATGDILQLAGLSLVVIAAIKNTIRSRVRIFALAFGVAAFSGVVQGYRPGLPVLDGLCDLLWGAETNVYFPVVPWFSIILFGMALGTHHNQAGHDTRLVFRTMLLSGLALAGIGGVLVLVNPELHLRDFFHLGPGGALHLMGVSAVLFWLAWAVEPSLRSTWLGRLANHCSKHVTSLYVIQWVLICWGMGIVGFQRRTALEVAVLAPVVLIVALTVDESIRRLWASVRSNLTPPIVQDTVRLPLS